MRGHRVWTIEEIEAYIAEVAPTLSPEDRARLEVNHAKFLAEIAVMEAKHAANMRALMVDFLAICTVCGISMVVVIVNAYTWKMDAVRWTCVAINALVALRALWQRFTVKARSRKLYGLDK